MPFDYNWANPRKKARKLTAAWRHNHRLAVIAQRRGHGPKFAYQGMPGHPEYLAKNAMRKISLTKTAKTLFPKRKKPRVVHNIIYKPPVPLHPNRLARTLQSELHRQKTFERSHKEAAYEARKASAVDMTDWWNKPEALVEDWDHHTPPAKYWTAPTVKYRRIPFQPGRYPPRAYAMRHNEAEDNLNKAHKAQQHWRFWYYLKHKKSI